MPHSDLLFEDHFDTPDLDTTKWFPHYLPHWTTSDTAARYRIADSTLRLFIASDQQPWFPELEGPLRVSNLQTGHFAGPLGSSIGQHGNRPELRVQRTVPNQRLFLPHHCRLEMRARAKLQPWTMAALWLIGYGERTEEGGEITLFEAFGDKVGKQQSSINRGVKRITDPKLVDEIDGGLLPVDVEDWHFYAMDWRADGIDFLVDGEIVTRTGQSPDYPMQLMLDIFDFSEPGTHDATQSWFDVDYIRAHATA